MDRGEGGVFFCANVEVSAEPIGGPAEQPIGIAEGTTPSQCGMRFHSFSAIALRM